MAPCLDYPEMALCGRELHRGQTPPAAFRSSPQVQECQVESEHRSPSAPSGPNDDTQTACTGPTSLQSTTGAQQTCEFTQPTTPEEQASSTHLGVRLNRHVVVPFGQVQVWLHTQPILMHVAKVEHRLRRATVRPRFEQSNTRTLT